MNKIKSLTLIALVILVSGIFVSAAAQKKPLPAEQVLPVMPLSGTYKIALTANELSIGSVELNTGETYGWTCYGTTDGDLTGYMFVSLNYSLPSPPDGESGDVAGGVSQVSAGSWSKLIFSNGQYLGSVYGKVVSGQLVWNGRDRTTSVRLNLTADDGTESFVGSTGTGTFEGVLDPNSKTSYVSGTLTLNY